MNMELVMVISKIVEQAVCGLDKMDEGRFAI
jgi:hypothetical protein